MKFSPALLNVVLLSQIGVLWSAESAIFIDRKIEAMKGTNNLIETLPRADSILPKNTSPTQKFEASINDLILKHQMGLEQLKKGLGKEGIVDTSPYMNRAKKSLNPRQKLAYLSTQLEELKKRTLSKKLQAFDLKVQLFHKGAMSLTSYIDLLTEMKNTPERDENRLPQIDLVKRLQSMESKINFEQVQHERTIIVRRLAYRLKGDDQKKLRKMVLAYRLGDTTHQEFYSFLQTACQKSGIKMDIYPHVKAYINYVIMASHLDEAMLNKEVNALEGVRYAQLSKNNVELALIKQTRDNINIAKHIEIESKNDALAWKR